jgi:hypothetical protein
VLDVAGLGVIAITSTGLTFAGNVARSDRDGAMLDRPMLMMGAAGAEMVVQSDGAARSLRHVSMTPNGQGTPAIAPLGAELRRAMAMMPPGAGGREMLLLDGVGLAPEQVTDLSTRAGVQLQREDQLKLLGVVPDSAASAQVGAEQPAPIASFAPAVSLALSASKPEALPLDFSHSRLAVVSKKRLGRNAGIAIAASVLVIVGIVYLYIQVNKSQHELDSLNARLKTMEPQIADAQKTVDRVGYARGYYDLRPSALECLRQFTLMFRDDEKIWVTNFNLKDNGKGSISGKAADQDTALKMVERLKQNTKFSALEHLDVHEADARTHEWQFSFNFTYNFAG